MTTCNSLTVETKENGEWKEVIFRILSIKKNPSELLDQLEVSKHTSAMT